MPVSEDETRVSDPAGPDVVDRARGILRDCADTEAVVGLAAEGEAICSILEPLDMPPVLDAAVFLYPAARDGHVNAKSLQKAGIPELTELVQGLVQLGRFELPADWKPGEALAVQQSEALRKMLLAVVADARLVVARIGEQVYRLRHAKTASPSERRAIAVETQEIYAPLANRLGIRLLTGEWEDLAGRGLRASLVRHPSSLGRSGLGPSASSVRRSNQRAVCRPNTVNTLISRAVISR